MSTGRLRIMQIRKSPALKIRAHWNDESRLKTVKESKFNLSSQKFRNFSLTKFIKKSFLTYKPEPWRALVKNNQSLPSLRVTLKSQVKNTFGRSVMHPEQNTTKKHMSCHLSHNNYWNIELRHGSHQIDSLALTQASVNQLPGSSDVNNRAVSVSSSVSDN